MFNNITQRFTQYKTQLYCLLLSLGIFSFDISIALGVAAAIPYTVVIVLSFKINSNKATIGFGLWCSLLTILGYLLSGVGGESWMVILNRALALLVIWSMVYLGLIIMNTSSKLYHSQKRFELFSEHSPLMIWQAEPTGNWTFVSLDWLSFTGKSNDEILNTGWLDSIHDDDKEHVSTCFKMLIEKQQSFHINCQLQHHSNEYHWISLQGNCYFSTSGDVLGYLGTASNIHQTKMAELHFEEIRQKYHHQEKMASLGNLASGILHEVGNPLASISGLLNEVDGALKSTKINDNDKNIMVENVTMITAEIERLSRICQDVSNFTNLQQSQELVDLNDLIERVCHLLSHDDRIWNIDLKLSLDKSIPALALKADYLIQILQNMISNAIDACVDNKAGAQIQVTTRIEKNHVVVLIKDNGSGMSEQVLAKAQHEFYTTKEKGTGLGLFICTKLTEKMQGKLHIESTEGEGTSIAISFPKP